MPSVVVTILSGAALVLVTAYGLGLAIARKTPVPPEVALALGAAAESFLVFLLIVAGVGRWYLFLAMAALAVACWRMFPRSPLGEASKRPLGKAWIAAAAIFGAYGLWYFINALAPEILADGMGYHLGLPYEYVRLGRFPARITFYDLVPQGMEMLYTAAFALGRHSAAKLVEFAFFAATLPLFFRISRRLGLGDLAGLVAAVFYCSAPVAGVTGASSYNDAAGVFFALAAFYLLLVWRDTGAQRYLVLSGILAGFCFAIKVPGVMAVAAAGLFVLSERRPLGSGPARSRLRNVAFLALGAALTISPWLLRNAIVAGNPLAPLLNWLFPNPYFHAATERQLAETLSSIGQVRPWTIPWQLAFGDGFAGTFGPLLLVLPAGLLALRRPAGRWCWAAAVLLALPWYSNTGARFLMPAVAVAALSLGMVLPPPAAWAAIALQALLCWPQVIDLRETRYEFRLREFPLRAALRIEAEDDYLWRHADEFKLARIVESQTPPDAKILALLSVANAYLARDVRVGWQSAQTDNLLDALRQAAIGTDPWYAWQASWPIASLQGLRFRVPAAHPAEGDFGDVFIYSGTDLVYPSPHWTLRAWPNSWEAPLALDGNLATRWRTWAPIRAGTYFEIRFDHPQRISSLVVYSHTPAFNVHLDLYGMDTAGHWRALGTVLASGRPSPDLRTEATQAILHAGYRYLVVPTGAEGAAPIGNAIVGREATWGLELVTQAGPYYLYRVK
jgi:4-amino-4-deoxy-L-arabinose transferase-like glycosyltransferase